MALILCDKCGGTSTIEGLNGLVECPECRGIGQKETDWVGTINQTKFLVDEVEPIIKSIETKVDTVQADVTKCLHRLKKIMDNLGVND